MPIEIRELVIKTEVIIGGTKRNFFPDEKELAQIKRHLLEECRRFIKENSKKRNIKR
ncbi:MAG: hypothetical protein IPP72_16860 [Chitinophagaceae bacterium]|nr:hypothetical protein [Chitinophagaceae bacterium]